MTYDPYPGNGGNGSREYPGDIQVPPALPPEPASVARAVRAMYAGAAVSVISVIIGLATSGSVSAQIRRARPDLTPSQVSAYAHFNLVSLIVLGLLGIGLWLWLARTCKQGLRWARLTGTGLFAIDTLLQVFGATQPISLVARIPGLVIWLIGLTAVILLWRKDCAPFFQGQPPGSPS